MPEPAFQPPYQPDLSAPDNPLYSEPTVDGPIRDPAVELIRRKILDLYAEEPVASEEIKEVTTHATALSPHEQYMQSLQASGKTITEIQAAWHEYYTQLPNQEKYRVWQDFYVANGQATINRQSLQLGEPASSNISDQPKQSEQQTYHNLPHPAQLRSQPQRTALARSRRAMTTVGAAGDRAAAHLKQAVTSGSAKDIRKRILQSVSSAASGGGKLKAKHHLQSLAFGLGMGLIVIFILMFGFFNEYIIAPFIQPSRHATETPVIVNVASTVVSGGPKVLIPKINVEIPVDYSQTTTDEKQIELALDKGIVHYPTTVMPGQTGNAAFFGHSSNNIFNPGKYKFAFVLLHELVEGDVFYLSDGGKTYAYRVFSKQIVKPSEVGVLSPIPGKTATATLITCDPPGTSLNRLVVVGEQISPDASGNTQPASPVPVVATTASSGLPGNGPTLWSRLWGSLF